MHIANELVEYVTPGDQEYEEIIEDYEEKVLVQEEFLEPPMTDTAVDTTPGQGNPRCVTLILLITIYIYVMHLHCRNYILVQVRVALCLGLSVA
jgi:hypothetical protein